MAFHKFSKWLLTDQGKKFTFLTGGFVSTAVMVGHILPQTILIDQYKDIIRLYKKGIPVALPTELEERFQKVLDILQVRTIEQPLYTPFHVYGFDVMSAGLSRSKFGAVIGIPLNFQYRSVDAAENKPTVLVDGSEELSWSSNNGQNLLASLILSEKAQMYAMAHEVKMRQTIKPILDMLYGTTSAMLTFSIASNINEKFKLYTKPQSLRLLMYSLVTIFFCATYLMLKDLTTVYLERKVDEDLKQIDHIFVEGGSEYYTKLIERNKTLRQILGKRGERLYTVLGNENSYIRTRHIPVVQRKEFFDKNIL